MKKLYLIRHAEASIAEAGTDDAKRKLTKKGKQDTKKIIKYLSDHKIRFGCIIASHATRAVETAKLIALGVCFPAESIFYDKRVYFEEARVFFDILEELDDSVTDVAIIGHNPELTAFAQYFLNDLSVVMSPSAMIGIEINSDNWSKIKQAVYKKLFIITP